MEKTVRKIFGRKRFRTVLIIWWFFILIFTYLWVLGWSVVLEIEPSTVVLDRNGAEIGELLNHQGNRHRPLNSDSLPVGGNMSWDGSLSWDVDRSIAVPPLLENSLVALEDRSFYSHPGVSPTAIARSLWNNLLVKFGYSNQAVQWGSTITMGLARNILGINRNRGVLEKLKEVQLALALELRYSKSQILHAYLDRVNFSRLSIGVGAASESYFGKSLGNLSPAELVTLLAVMKNPVGYDPIKEPEAFQSRFELVLNRLEQTGVISNEMATQIRNEPLHFSYPDEKLPYVIDTLQGNLDGKVSTEEVSQVQNRGARITTSIDLSLSEKVRKIAESVRTWLQYRNVSDYAILIADRETGKVRVLIGGANYGGDAGQVNSVFAPRQIGSTVKPFTYLLAVTEKWHHMQDMILDAPVNFLTSEGNPYEPKNYSLTYRGLIPLTEALAGSVNIPAMKIAQEVGVGRLLDFLRSLGISSLDHDADYYGLALTLGVGEVSIWELLRAYTVFSHDGEFCGLHLLENSKSSLENSKTLIENSKSDCRKVADPAGIGEIVDTLSSEQYKVAEFPYGSSMDFGEGKVFVKTGTSRNFRDNYAIGFTSQYMIAIWSGNKDGSNMRGVSGASGAGEIFAGILGEVGMGKWLSDLRSPNMEKPDVGKWDSGMVKPMKNSNLPFGPSDVRHMEITNPLSGGKYQLDAHTPLAKQNIRIKFWTDTPYDRAEYVLNGKKLPDEILPFSQILPGQQRLKVVLYKGSDIVAENEVAFGLE